MEHACILSPTTNSYRECLLAPLRLSNPIFFLSLYCKSDQGL
jgi:hypothetical protein